MAAAATPLVCFEANILLEISYLANKFTLTVYYIESYTCTQTHTYNKLSVHHRLARPHLKPNSVRKPRNQKWMNKKGNIRIEHDAYMKFFSLFDRWTKYFPLRFPCAPAWRAPFNFDAFAFLWKIEFDSEFPHRRNWQNSAYNAKQQNYRQQIRWRAVVVVVVVVFRTEDNSRKKKKRRNNKHLEAPIGPLSWATTFRRSLEVLITRV